MLTYKKLTINLNICGLIPVAITTPLTTLAHTSGGGGYNVDYTTFFTPSVVDSSCSLVCYLQDSTCTTTLGGSLISVTNSGNPFNMNAINT